MKKAILVLTTFLCFMSCSKESTPSIEGSWNIISIETKSASIGSDTVDIWLQFGDDGRFVIYQKTGEGRYESYDGTWYMNGHVLSGKYSDGKEWANDYQVSVNKTTLTLKTRTTPCEVSSYIRAEIPEGILLY